VKSVKRYPNVHHLPDISNIVRRKLRVGKGISMKIALRNCACFLSLLSKSKKALMTSCRCKPLTFSYNSVHWHIVELHVFIRLHHSPVRDNPYVVHTNSYEFLFQYDALCRCMNCFHDFYLLFWPRLFNRIVLHRDSLPSLSSSRMIRSKADQLSPSLYWFLIPFSLVKRRS